MAYTGKQINQIFTFLGYSQILKVTVPNIKRAILDSQSTTDGGCQPDSELEISVQAKLARIEQLDELLMNATISSLALSDGDTKIDSSQQFEMTRVFIDKLCKNISNDLAIPLVSSYAYPTVRKINNSVLIG